MYENKNKKYFSNPRFDLIGLIKKSKNNRILEIGSGNGDTLIELKRLNIANEVVGIELLKIPNSRQEDPQIDRMIFGNIEMMDIDLPEDYFDVIICGDVLEHLIDPWNTLKKVRKHLKRDGIIIISIPNFREINNLYKIIVKADFGYEDIGILDRTHLRFFCKKNILSLLNSTLYTPLEIYSIFQLDKVWSKKKIFSKLTLGLFNDFITKQYIVVAIKK